MAEALAQPNSTSVHRWLPRLATILLIATYLLRLYITRETFTHTVDEPANIGSALPLVEARKHIHNIQHPPLTRLLIGVVLRLSGIEAPQWRGVTTVQNDLDSWPIGNQILFHSPVPYAVLLGRIRAAMLLFPAIALLYTYLLAGWISGRWTGVVAVALLSIDPTLLGHGLWATSDTAAAAMFVAAAYHGLRWIARPGWLRALAMGAAIALAVGAKFSGLLIVPALAIVGILWWFIARRQRDSIDYRNRPQSRPMRRISQLLAAMLVAFVTLWAVYLFDIGRLSDQVEFHDEPAWRAIPDQIKNAPIPMPSLWLGLLKFTTHNEAGHLAYLNGKLSTTGWWTYFPEAIGLKTPLAALAAILLALICMIGKRKSPDPLRLSDLGEDTAAAQLSFSVFAQPISASHLHLPLAPLLIAATFFAFAMSSNIDIGIRHILPVFPLLYAFTAAQLWCRARWTRVTLLGLIALAALETAAVHPDYFSYFNLAAGGSAGGERYLIDSNIDWGQDVGRLEDWLDRKARGRLVTKRIFGWDDQTPVPAETHFGDPLRLPPGWLAISINRKRGLESQGEGGPDRNEDFSFLSRYPPLARIGTSIEVYDLDAIRRNP